MEHYFSFDDIYYKFNDTDRYVRESGCIGVGSVLVLQGPSGAGKSTLLKILARLVKPDKGYVFLEDRPWNLFPPNDWRLNVQYVSQQPILFEGTVQDNLLLPYTFRTVQSYRQVPEIRLIRKCINELGLNEDLLRQKANTLSGGEKARIALLRSILIDPKVLLLDEPSAYLDGHSKEMIMTFLNDWVVNNKRAIVMASHSQEDLTYFSNTEILHIEPRRNLQ